MKKRVVAMSAIMLALVASASWGELRQLGMPAPKLEVEFVQGEPFNLTEGVGENFYLVEFWATWCGPCRSSIPHLSKIYEKYKKRGLKVVGISDETADIVVPYMNEMGEKMSYPVALDPETKTTRGFFNAYGVNSIPTAFLVDTRGNVVWRGHPMDRMMEDFILALAKQKDALRAANRARRSERPSSTDIDQRR